MNEEKDKMSLQESEEQYGSCAQSELMQLLDASASQLTADDVAYLEKREKALILMDKYYWRPSSYSGKGQAGQVNIGDYTWGCMPLRPFWPSGICS